MLVLIALAVCCQAYKYSGSTTVSGLSAGGFFAVQMHVAFSRSINGSAIFAGGPYFCSNGVLETALTACMVKERKKKKKKKKKKNSETLTRSSLVGSVSDCH